MLAMWCNVHLPTQDLRNTLALGPRLHFRLDDFAHLQEVTKACKSHATPTSRFKPCKVLKQIPPRKQSGNLKPISRWANLSPQVLYPRQKLNMFKSFQKWAIMKHGRGQRNFKNHPVALAPLINDNQCSWFGGTILAQMTPCSMPQLRKILRHQPSFIHKKATSFQEMSSRWAPSSFFRWGLAAAMPPPNLLGERRTGGGFSAGSPCSSTVWGLKQRSTWRPRNISGV